MRMHTVLLGTLFQFLQQRKPSSALSPNTYRMYIHMYLLYYLAGILICYGNDIYEILV